MKKLNKTKLNLDRETIRQLSELDLRDAGGGATTRSALYPCVTMGFACGSGTAPCLQ
jgi:natural product precursor